MKGLEPCFFSCRKGASLSMQVNGHGLGMERLIRKQQVGTIFIGKSAIDQRKVISLIQAIEFVAHNRMTYGLQVNSNLMFPPGQRANLQQAVGLSFSLKSFQDSNMRRGGCAIFAHIVLDLNRTAEVFPK